MSSFPISSRLDEIRARRRARRQPGPPQERPGAAPGPDPAPPSRVQAIRERRAARQMGPIEPFTPEAVRRRWTGTYAMPRSTGDVDQAVAGARRLALSREAAAREREHAAGMTARAEAGMPLGIWDALADVARAPETVVPFIGAGMDTLRAVDLYRAAQRAEEGRATERDWALLERYVSEGKVDRTIGNRVVSILANLPAFAGEIAMTGGLFGVGRAAGRKLTTAAVQQLLARRTATGALRSGAARLAVKTGGALTGALAQTPAFTHRIIGSTVEHMLQDGIQVTPEEGGRLGIVLNDEGDGFLEALPRGILDTYIELASERAGGALEFIPGAAKLAGLKAAVMRRWLRVNPDNTVGQFLDRVAGRVGWHGVLGEIFEERVGDAARYATGLQDDLVPEWDQLIAEAVAFAVPAAVGTAAEVVAGRGQVGEGSRAPGVVSAPPAGRARPSPPESEEAPAPSPAEAPAPEAPAPEPATEEATEPATEEAPRRRWPMPLPDRQELAAQQLFASDGEQSLEEANDALHEELVSELELHKERAQALWGTLRDGTHPKTGKPLNDKERAALEHALGAELGAMRDKLEEYASWYGAEAATAMEAVVGIAGVRAFDPGGTRGQEPVQHEGGAAAEARPEGEPAQEREQAQEQVAAEGEPAEGLPPPPPPAKPKKSMRRKSAAQQTPETAPQAPAQQAQPPQEPDQGVVTSLGTAAQAQPPKKSMKPRRRQAMQPIWPPGAQPVTVPIAEAPPAAAESTAPAVPEGFEITARRELQLSPEEAGRRVTRYERASMEEALKAAQWQSHRAGGAPRYVFAAANGMQITDTPPPVPFGQRVIEVRRTGDVVTMTTLQRGGAGGAQLTTSAAPSEPFVGAGRPDDEGKQEGVADGGGLAGTAGGEPDAVPRQKGPVEVDGGRGTHTPKSTGILSALSPEKQARAEELKRRLAAKINTELRSGFDPELLAIGAELTALYVEAGARTFAKFARALVGEMGDAVKPYLKSFYLAARNMPGVDPQGMDSAGYVDGLDERTIDLILADREDKGERAADESQPGGAAEGVGALREPDAGAVGHLLPGGAGGGTAGGGGGPAAGGAAGPGGAARAGTGEGADARPGRKRRSRRAGPATGDRRDDRGGDADAAASGTSDAPAVAPGDFVITDPAALGAGGPKTKFQQNIRAIETLRRIQAEARPATREEQAILALYVGWGMFPQVFNRESAWREEYEQLRALLTPEEWAAARQSTQNAHYTSAAMVQAMWRMADRLGFTGGRVLEPSMGTGNFIGLMPPAIKGASVVVGVELDRTTGAIAKLLYPQSQIRVQGFQELQVPHGFFDLAISNVPFGDYRVHDPEYNKLRLSIHDYFFVRALDRVRPGGLVMFVTSRFTMDKEAKKAREAIAQRADLVAAFRLPDRTFEANAGTQVVTDVVILRRRADGEAPAGPKWMEVVEVPDPDGGAPIPINEYYRDHPENILGRLDRSGTMYGPNQINVSATDDFEQRLERAIERLPAGVYRPASVSEAFKAPTLDQEAGKEGALRVRDGKVYRRVRGALVEQEGVSEADARVLAAVLEVRDAARKVLVLEAGDADEATITAAREELNRVYDAYVRKHGPLSKRATARLYADDPDAGFILALEVQTGKARPEKAEIFRRRTVRGYKAPESAASVGDALGISLGETGGVDVARIASLTGLSPEAVTEELVSKGLAFEEPGGGWVVAERYLSGNVRQKLADARAAASIDPKYARNVEALEKVQPADVDYEEIEARIGASWIPPEDYQQWAADLLGGEPSDFKVAFAPNSGQWIVEYSTRGANRFKGSAQATQIYGTPRAEFIELWQKAMNRGTVTIRDRTPNGEYVINQEATNAANAKIKELAQHFRDWIWQDDERRIRLHRFYNDNFNNVVTPKYDGRHQTFPGLSPTESLMEHQANCVWRIVSDRRALVAHEVGAGKTYTLVAAAMELRRLGIARKPCIAVLKATGPQFVDKARQMYPGAKIASLVGIDDAAKRREMLARIGTGDYDMVIMTHEQLAGLPVRPELEEAWINEQIEELEAAHDAAKATEGKNSRFVKQLAKAIEQLQTNRREILERKAIKQDQAIFFEETGIDFLMVDEAHRFKSLPVNTSLNVKGVPRGSGAGRAAQLYMKARYIQSLQKGRGLVLATGTPITNSLAELFIMQRYLQEDELKSRGIQAFDGWVADFGDIVSKVEFTVAGEYAETSRLAAFINVPELASIFRQVIDVKRIGDMPWIQRPKRVDTVHTVTMNPGQRAKMQELASRARALKGKPPEPGSDNILVIANEGRLMSTDLRIVDPDAEDDPNGKIALCARLVLQILAEHPGTTQMVFADRFRSNLNPSFDVFDDLTAKLVAGGIPADKIINFSDLTEAQKRTAADRLKRGEAWIGLGSTATLGTGVNAQDHLIALHHLDAPWTPAEVEQRDGRGWRQGNKNPVVQIHRYVTEKAFDVFMWQTLARKAAFISQVMSDGPVQRVVQEEDVEELTPDQVMAIATGDPRVLEKIQLDADVAELEAAERRHRQQQTRYRDLVAQIKRELEFWRSVPEAIAKDKAQADATRDQDFVVTVKDREYRDELAAVAAMQEVAEMFGPGVVGRELGMFRGFRVVADSYQPGVGVVFGKLIGPSGRDYPVAILNRVTTANPETGNLETTTTPVFANSARAVLSAHAFDQRASSARVEIDSREVELRKTEEQIGQPFKRAGELAEKRARRDALAKAIADTAGTAREADRRAALIQKLESDIPRAQELARQLELSDRKEGLAERIVDAMGVDRVTELIGEWRPFESMGAAPSPDYVVTEGGTVRMRIPTARELAGGGQGLDRAPQSQFPLSDPEVERRWRESHGLSKLGLAAALRRWWIEWRETIARGLARGSIPDLPRTRTWGEARQVLLNIRKTVPVAQWQTAYALRRELKPLSAAEMELYEKIVALRDLVQTEGALPWGYSDRAQVQADLDRLEAEARKHPGVELALKTRAEKWKAWKGDYVEAARRLGWDVEKRLQRKDYFRHQVLYWINLKRLLPETARATLTPATPGGGPSATLRTGRGFLKRREGSGLDINSSYLQAEWEVMSIMRADTLYMRQLLRLKAYDILPQLKERARAENNARALEKIRNELRDAGQPADTLAEAAAKEYRDRYNKGIAVALGRIRKLARDGELEAPGFEDVVAYLQDRVRRAKGATVDPLPPDRAVLKRVYAWASWAARHAEANSASRAAARSLLKATSERKRRLMADLGKDYATWETVIPEGYQPYYIRPGRVAFMAETIPERLLNQILESNGLELRLAPDDLQKLMALGGNFTPWVVPVELAKAMNKLTPAFPNDPIHRLARWAMRLWKFRQLFFPDRWFRYRFRNQTEIEKPLTMTRDVEGFMKLLPKASADLAKLFTYGENIPAEVRAWQERGGAAALIRLQELGEVNALRFFRELTVQPERGLGRRVLRAPAWAAEQYADKLGRLNDYLESVYRYAKFLHYWRQMQADPEGKPLDFGGSVPEEVMGIKDIADRAWKLSNDLFGAYDDVSVFGDYLRRNWIPFWAFKELNFRTYLGAIRNLWRDPRVAYGKGRAIAKIAGGAALRMGAAQTINLGRVAIMLGGFYLLTRAINLLVMGAGGDDRLEADLPDEVRRRPHLVFGRDAEGRVRFLDRLGTSGDFLAWFGVEAWIDDALDLIGGRRTLPQIIEEAAKAPVNQMVQGVGPHIKAPMEFLAGRQLFPDAFRPRSIRDRWRYVFDQIGLGEWFADVTDRPARALGDRLTGAFYKSADADAAAYWWVQDEKRRFLQTKGMGGGFTESARSNALYYFKLGIRYRDLRAAQKYLTQYFAYGGTMQDLERSLEAMHPLAGMNDRLRAEFYDEHLDDTGRERVERAARYWEDVILGRPGDVEAVIDAAAEALP